MQFIVIADAASTQPMATQMIVVPMMRSLGHETALERDRGTKTSHFTLAREEGAPEKPRCAKTMLG